MSLEALFLGIADALDGSLAIEFLGRNELIKAASQAHYEGEVSQLEKPYFEILKKENTHPVCELIKNVELFWAPPQTSTDPNYITDSIKKAHVELLGPEGLVKSNKVRIGLYGMLPNADYGIRTHPAEEVFVMLAGETYWKRGDADYILHGVGERSYHPSMLPHAQYTADLAFMSVYVWSGDVSTQNYVYQGTLK